MEGDKAEQGIKNLFEKMTTENILNLGKETDTQVQEAQGILNKKNPKRPTSKYIIVKMSKVKDKERILKVAREKQLVTYKGTPLRLSAGFSTETLHARRRIARVRN